MNIEWENAPYLPGAAQRADVGPDRLLVRRTKPYAKTFRGTINGDFVGIWEDVEEAKRHVEIKFMEGK